MRPASSLFRRRSVRPPRRCGGGLGCLIWTRGLLLGLAILLAGAVCIGDTLCVWWAHHFGPLEGTRTLRLVVVGATLVALGVQTVLMSFFYSMLGLRLKSR